MRSQYPDREKALGQVRRALKARRTPAPTPAVGLLQIVPAQMTGWEKYQQGLTHMAGAVLRSVSPPLYPPRERS